MVVGRKANNRRKRIGYIPDVPSCDRCVHFKGSYMELRNSTPQWHEHRCIKFDIVVAARGRCDHWKSKKTGETLNSQTKEDADDVSNT